MANESYIQEGTALTLNGTAGADYVMNFDGDGADGLAGTELEVSAQVDLGAGPRPYRYNWSLKVKTAGSGSQYNAFELYIAQAPEADSSQIDGNGEITASAARLTDGDIRYALRHIGNAVLNEIAADTYVGSGVFETTFRYATFVVYNGSGAALTTTDSDHKLIIEPVYDIPGT